MSQYWPCGLWWSVGSVFWTKLLFGLLCINFSGIGHVSSHQSSVSEAKINIYPFLTSYEFNKKWLLRWIGRYREMMLWLFHHSCTSPHRSYLMSLSSSSCCLKCGQLDADLFHAFCAHPKIKWFWKTIVHYVTTHLVNYSSIPWMSTLWPNQHPRC